MHHNSINRSPSQTVFGLFTLIRPKQWIKNGFVLAPLLFTGEFLIFGAAKNALIAMALFCIASSAAYIVNDLKDIEADRRHPKKSLNRPLASGQVSIFSASILLIGLYAILIAAWFHFPKVINVIAAYLVINIAYSFVLKHQPVVDIFTIAIGFVLRVYCGATALNVPVSNWMFITTLCLALYLAALKRRQELSQNGEEGRSVLKNYSVSLVDRYAEMSATGAMVFYSIFVTSAKPELVITVPFVLFGLFRYWYVVEELGGGESPTDALFADWQLLLCVVLWIAVCVWSLWPSLR
jgi:decaprenyl-phosphate phosphoribosyltransferase